jgi:hypothetical protein
VLVYIGAEDVGDGMLDKLQEMFYPEYDNVVAFWEHPLGVCMQCNGLDAVFLVHSVVQAWDVLNAWKCWCDWTFRLRTDEELEKYDETPGGIPYLKSGV